MYLLLGLTVAHFQRRVIVNERSFKIIDSNPVDTALFTVQLDPVKVGYCRDYGQLNIALSD